VTIVESHVDGHPILVSCPGESTGGSIPLDVAELLARARQRGVAVCLLPDSIAADHPLFALRSERIVRVDPAGARGRWLRARWWISAVLARAVICANASAAVFWREIYRELRRHIGDERLPYALRTRLRTIADRSMERSTHATGRVSPDIRARRLLREPLNLRMPASLERTARDEATRCGVSLDRPIVALEFRSRLESLGPAIDRLVRDGYAVVRIGPPGGGPLDLAGVVDLTTTEHADALDLNILMRAKCLVCESPTAQQIAYLTDTPCIRLNVVDPYEAYPLRADGLFTLATPVELNTGRELSVEEGLAPEHVRHLDRFAHRPNRSSDVLAAVEEMLEIVNGAHVDTVRQARYRARIVETAQTLPSNDHRRPDDGFIGDGRLARVQADHVS